MNLTNLTPTSGSHEKLSALKDFLGSWYELSLSDRKIDLAIKVPEPLRIFYGFAEPHLKTIFAQNRLVAPEKLTRRDDRLVFLVENQGVWEWATAEQGEDPQVWQWIGDNQEWTSASPTLSTALVYASLAEASISAPCRATSDSLSDQSLKLLSKHLKALPFEKIPSLNGGQYWAKDNVVAWVGPAYGGEGHGILVAGTNSGDMEFVWDLSDDTWEIDI